MTRLGIRLALSGGAGGAIGLALTAVAVAMGTAILLLALSFRPALDARFERAAWREPQVAEEPPADAPTTFMRVADDRFGDRPIVTVLIAAADDGAPVPPGIPALPAAGTSYVSPALAALIAATPPDQLGDRYGRVIGTIADASLRSPDELVAITGIDRGALEDLGPMPIWTFEGTAKTPEIPELLMLVVVLAVAGALAPVAVFVATATRLSAARREQRLAALRLVGATPRQIVGFAIVESLLSTVTGAIAGVALFLLVRPLVALVPLDETGWFPDTIAPPLVPAAVLVALVPVVGAIAALVALRRVVVTPLGVRQRATPRPPSALRVVPLVVSIVALLASIWIWRARGVDTTLGLLGVGVAFVGIIGGLAFAGPWLTSRIGAGLRRIPAGAATLLAARRLTDDPRGSFGSIAGVVMAVFVAAAFFTFTAYTTAAGGSGDPLMRQGQLLVELPYGAGGPADDLVARVQESDGVSGVLAVRAVELFVDGDPVTAWVVPCGDLVAAVDAAGVACDGRPVHAQADWLAPGTFTLVPDRGVPQGAARRGFDVTFRATDIGTFQTSDLASGWLPEILIEPSFLGDRLADVGLTKLYVTTDGSAIAMERIRTEVVAATPGAVVQATAQRAGAEPIYAEFGRVVSLGLIGTMVLAGCSLAVAVTTGMLDRRRQFALLRSAGMPVSRLRALVLLQAGAPLVAVAVASAVLGVLVAMGALLAADAGDVPFPDAELPITLGLSLLGAMVLVSMMLPALERLTRPEQMRLE